ncbi:hypothetical protein HanPSC8_Chr12g0508061 [Helianthus annuus]|nr:hypothetical protein HanPSC8_Chr12g0508061 [Helianthus annuus]
MKCENKGFVTYTACSEFDLKVYGLIWFTVINFLHLFSYFMSGNLRKNVSMLCKC